MKYLVIETRGYGNKYVIHAKSKEEALEHFNKIYKKNCKFVNWFDYHDYMLILEKEYRKKDFRKYEYISEGI